MNRELVGALRSWLRRIVVAIVLFAPSLAQSQLLDSYTPSAGVFEVELQLRPSCVLGDADAIKLDSSIPTPGEDKEILVSFEPLIAPLPGSAAVSQVQSLTQGDLGSSGVARFSLPKLASGSGLEAHGLFICLRNSKSSTRSCRNKPVVAYSEIFKNHEVPIDRSTFKATRAAAKRPVPERLYFFRPLFIQGTGVLSLSRSLSKPDYAELDKLLGTGLEPKQLKPVLNQIERFGSLGSLPLKRSPTGYKIVLPFYDTRKCVDSGS